MQVSLAASTVLNAAAPGVVAAGLSGGATATDGASSPFDGLLEGLLQPATPSASGAGTAADSSIQPQSNLAITAPAVTVSPDVIASPSAQGASLTPALVFGGPLMSSAESADPKTVAAQALSASQSDDSTAQSTESQPPPSTLSTQPKTAAPLGDSSKSKSTKAAQTPTDPQPGVGVLAPVAAPIPVVDPTALSQAADTANAAPATQTDQTPTGRQAGSQTAMSSAVPEAFASGIAATTSATAPSASPQIQTQSTLTSAALQPGSMAAPDLSASAQAPLAQTASTAMSASAASGAFGIPQSPSSSQQPSAVAQFTGRSKAGSQTFATARSASPGQTQAASPPPGIGAVKDGAGPSADRVGDVAAAPASDAAQGDQTAPSSGQNTASTDVGSDAAAQQATLGAAVQTGPAADAPIAGASAASATIANLSAQIAQKAGGQTTRFDVQLDPIGLGRVNVSVEIDAKGAMSAALSFEKPEAASLLKSHSAELQQSLAQAGFDLSNGALSFSTADQGGRGGAGQAAFLGAGANDGGGQQPQGGQAQTAGRAFGAASFAADQADQISTTARTLSARGLDIRI
jgi:hypothetical protein